MNPWVEFIRTIAKRLKVSYPCALSQISDYKGEYADFKNKISGKKTKSINELKTAKRKPIPEKKEKIFVPDLGVDNEDEKLYVPDLGVDDEDKKLNVPDLGDDDEDVKKVIIEKVPNLIKQFEKITESEKSKTLGAPISKEKFKKLGEFLKKKKDKKTISSLNKSKDDEVLEKIAKLLDLKKQKYYTAFVFKRLNAKKEILDKIRNLPKIEIDKLSRDDLYEILEYFYDDNYEYVNRKLKMEGKKPIKENIKEYLKTKYAPSGKVFDVRNVNINSEIDKKANLAYNREEDIKLEKEINKLEFELKTETFKIVDEYEEIFYNLKEQLEEAKNFSEKERLIKELKDLKDKNPLINQYLKTQKVAVIGPGKEEYFYKNSIIGLGLGPKIRRDFKPEIRDLLAKVGNRKITSLTLQRVPIESMLKGVLNFLTMGKYKETTEKLGYDKIFHLSMIVTLEGLNSPLVVEKNEVINISSKIPPMKQGGARLSVPVNKDITLNELLKNAESKMGNRFYLYDAFNQRGGGNCQDFIYSLLKYSNLSNPQAEKFILQDAKAIVRGLPIYTSYVTRGLTDLGAQFDRIIYGKGT